MQWLLLLLFIPYIYLLLEIYRGLLKLKPYVPSEASEIFITIIVPCRNEEKNIPLLLSDIANQTYDHDLFELIMVDDNSSDRTYEAVSAFTNITNLKVMKNSGSGKKAAIKTGIEACRGSVIVTTDADCRVGKHWLKTIVSFTGENDPEMVVGPVRVDGGTGFSGRFQELEFLSLQGVTAGTTGYGNPVMCNGANLLFTRESYIKNIGNLHFELTSGDDVFLLHGIKKDSGKILWLESEDASVSTGSEPTLSGFLRQRARWISKSGAYRDHYTKLLAIVTFATVLLQLFLLVSGLFNLVFLMIFLAGLLLKSIPDFLILQNRVGINKKKNLLWFFLPGELIYPFYILSVVIFYLFTKANYRYYHP
jgi:poly-beta-1,6-N-acetyl-D-glucosamine synthase